VGSLQTEACHDKSMSANKGLIVSFNGKGSEFNDKPCVNNENCNAVFSKFLDQVQVLCHTSFSIVLDFDLN
jgi:hypothetical protein